MSIFSGNKPKMVRFGRDRSIRITKVARNPFTDAYQVTPTKAVIVSESHQCEFWTFPLWGFGKYFKMPAVKREPLMAGVMGDAVTLSPVKGHENNYRETSTIASDQLKEFADAADYHASQITQIKGAKGNSDPFMVMLAVILLVEVMVFAAVILPIAIPKIMEVSANSG